MDGYPARTQTGTTVRIVQKTPHPLRGEILTDKDGNEWVTDVGTGLLIALQAAPLRDVDPDELAARQQAAYDAKQLPPAPPPPNSTL